ncbi:MAG TPA: hypothetical protein VJH96_02635 [Patescibacteria group bacterium]|nr:hypothetical protein [Patescibacteria group bacterium]
MVRKIIFPVLLVFLLFFYSLTPRVSSQSETEKRQEELGVKIEEYTRKLSALESEKNTLSSQINYMDTQISITTFRIQQTEENIVKTTEEIGKLTKKVDDLNSSLDYLSTVMIQKIIEGYKAGKTDFFDMFLDEKNLGTLVNRFKYLKVTQNNDQRIAFQAQQAKVNFEEQKELREEKKKKLDELKITLGRQKIALNEQRIAKERLLEVTKNDEKIYQDLLAKARAEYAAIQGIIAGKGTEVKLRDVVRGDAIATVISGRSCNSSGSHLHFITQENNNVVNPFQYLKPVEYNNCSGSSCGSGDGDGFNPSGSWEWPLSPIIKMNQGYGTTWAVRNTWVGRVYNFHNGIDIIGSSDKVSAVADGTLYRGSFSVGCSLHYVKLVHKDSNVSTLYLHVYAL